MHNILYQFIKFKMPLFFLNSRELKDQRGFIYYFPIILRPFCIPRLRHKSSYAFTSGRSLSQQRWTFFLRTERETSDMFRHDGACIQWERHPYTEYPSSERIPRAFHIPTSTSHARLGGRRKGIEISLRYFLHSMWEMRRVIFRQDTIRREEWWKEGPSAPPRIRMGLMYIFIAVESERPLKIYNAITPSRRRRRRGYPALRHAKCLRRKDEKQCSCKYWEFVTFSYG